MLAQKNLGYQSPQSWVNGDLFESGPTAARGHPGDRVRADGGTGAAGKLEPALIRLSCGQCKYNVCGSLLNHDFQLSQGPGRVGGIHCPLKITISSWDVQLAWPA
jgi:hypothetical protein